MIVYDNIQFLMPEVFLTLAINILLVLGLFRIKIDKISQLILFLTGLLLVNDFFIIADNGIFENNNWLIVIKLIITITGFIIFNISPHHIKTLEFHILILLSILGMFVLISGTDLIMIYLGIELLSLSLYILASSKRASQLSTEAGLKYLILGAVSTGLLLLGSAIIYYMTGEIGIYEIGSYIWFINSKEEGWIIIGAILIIISILFKLAAAPFHMWAPDVYEGSPTIITAYFAIVPKIVLLSVLIKLLFGPFLGLFDSLQPILLISALLSLIVGSLGAINQSKFKRLIAYSAIGHMGWMLIGVAGFTFFSFSSSLFYMVYYIIMSIAMFIILLTVYPRTHNAIFELTGLSRINPILAITLALLLLSMAGVPPMVGFYNKYLIIIEAINSSLWLVVGIAILTSVISTYYYLQIIKIMYFFDNKDSVFKVLGDMTQPQQLTISQNSSIILGFMLWFIITGLVYPSPILNLINYALSAILI